MRLLDIYKINKENVGKDCVQVMIDFMENLEITNDKTGHTLFYFEKFSIKDYKNDYIDDDRRKNFPYSNIPVHRQMDSFIKYYVTNQILEYDTVYTLNHFYMDYSKDLSGKKIDKFSHMKVIKDKDSALMLVGIKDLLLDMNAEKIHDLETLGIVKIKKIKEPQIPVLLNRNIPKDEIVKAKKLVKEKRAR